MTEAEVPKHAMGYVVIIIILLIMLFISLLTGHNATETMGTIDLIREATVDRLIVHQFNEDDFKWRIDCTIKNETGDDRYTINSTMFILGDKFSEEVLSYSESNINQVDRHRFPEFFMARSPYEVMELENLPLGESLFNCVVKARMDISYTIYDEGYQEEGEYFCYLDEGRFRCDYEIERVDCYGDIPDENLLKSRIFNCMDEEMHDEERTR